MSKKYPGGLIRKTPPTITPPVGGEGGSAPGVWTLEQASYYTKQGTWPKPVLPRELYAWGGNSNGQLGIGNIANQSSPVQVGSLITWNNLALGFSCALVTKTDGTLWAWGNNTLGELGLDDTVRRSSPVQVGGLTTWSQVAGGTFHSLATKTDGTLWSWGYNEYGQLGLNIGYINKSSPTQIGALTTWSKVAGATYYSIATKTDGTLWSWGINDFGQLGQNDRVYRSSPVQVGGTADWSNISSGATFVIAVKTNGTMWSWGRNNAGQLGLNIGYTNRSSPSQIGALTTWSNVSCGQNFAIALKTDGTLWSWGRNNEGDLGLGDTVYRSSPVQIGALTTWYQIAAGDSHSLALKTDGTLWVWGRNNNGQLGLGNSGVSQSSPVQVGSLATWLKLARMPVSQSSIATKS